MIPLATQHFMMLQRSLLYTAVTRGKKLVVLVGSKRAVSLAVQQRRREAPLHVVRRARACGRRLSWVRAAIGSRVSDRATTCLPSRRR